MRLFLHGRSGTTELVRRIKEAQEFEELAEEANSNGTVLPPFGGGSSSTMCSWASSASSSSASSSLTTQNRPQQQQQQFYSSLLLSNWDVDEMDEAVVDALESFLLRSKKRRRNTDPSERHQQQPLSPREGKTIIQTCPSFSSSVSESSLLSDLTTSTEVGSGEERDGIERHKKVIRTKAEREIILHNCEGEEDLENLVAAIAGLETTAELTVRYDKQRDLPIRIARGLRAGAESCKSGIRCIELKGMTITVKTVNYLRRALPFLSNLEELTIRGNITLAELDGERPRSILGENGTRASRIVLNSLCDTIRMIAPTLKVLDLQRCHLPDEYLSAILQCLLLPTPTANSATPDSKRRSSPLSRFSSSAIPIVTANIRALKLNGNVARQKSQSVLYRLLTSDCCQLRHLDLSWQRYSNAQGNRSVLDLEALNEGLDVNKSLTTLNVSENKLLDGDVGRLSVAVSNHPTMRTLRLQNCSITDRGVIAIATRIPHCNDTLKHVHIDGIQRVRNVKHVRRVLFDALLQNVYLKELDLPYNLHSDSMDWTVELNRNGARQALSALSRSYDEDDRDRDVLRNERRVDCVSDPAIECVVAAASTTNNEGKRRADKNFPSTTLPYCFVDSQSNERNRRGLSSSFSNAKSALWPLILEKADRMARNEYLAEEKSSTVKAASTMYLMLRETGYRAILANR